MKRLVTFAIASTSMLALCQSAEATSMLLLEDLSNNAVVTIADNGVGDLDPMVGAISFSGTLGIWTVTTATGTTKPALGTATAPQLLNSAIVSASAVGSLRIAFTETDFGPGLLNLSYGVSGSLAGPSGSSVAFSAFADASNVPFGTATSLGNLGTFGPGPISGTLNPITTLSFPSSLSLDPIITMTGPGTASFDSMLVPAPEPGTLVLMGLGLASTGVGLRLRQRRRSSAAATHSAGGGTAVVRRRR